ncbi:MAG: hypothetical protein CSA32_03570 [Desulfobulbus propionicus]|nr:MAG: hypothetical protein CSA32_03570 [Desulfobulbus propionicus]
MEFLKIWEIIVRRKWIVIGVFLLFFFIVVLGLNMVTETYEANAKILFKKNQALDHLKTILDLTGDKAFDDDYEFETEIALATVRPLVEDFITSLALKDRSGEQVDANELTDPSLLNKFFPQPSIEIEQYEDSHIIEIIASSTVPEEAAQMANVFAGMYMEAQVELIKDEYKEARNFINDKLKKVRQDYFTILSEIREFKGKEGIVDLDSEAEKLLNVIYEIRANYEENERNIISLDDTITQIQAKLSTIEQYKLDSKELSLNDMVQSLESSVNDYLVSIAASEVELETDHPDYLMLEAKLKKASDLIKDKERLTVSKQLISADPVYENLRSTLIDNLVEKEVSRAKRKLWLSYIDKYQERLMQFTVKQVENALLASKSTVAQETYEQLLEYKANVNIAESVTLGNIHLVESATIPDEAEFPKKIIILLLAGLPGAFWALGLAFLVDYIDITIKTPDDLEKVISLNIIDDIPRLRMIQRKMTLLNMPFHSLAAKHLRSFANKARFSLPHDPHKTIMITSATEKEGKTCLAANFALALSQMGQKVLLVDLDLNHPSIHKIFSLQNKTGALQVVTGKAALEEGICSIPGSSLSVLPSGSSARDSLQWREALYSGAFLDETKQHFDAVIIDSSSLLPDYEAVYLGQLMDAVIWVIGAGHVTPNKLTQTKSLLDKAQINLAGVIFNKTTACY